ncbi:protein of unknown function [Rhodovastum atsumiense]|nr:protein of unknown function [Rhodovastum atsumiense]
MKLESHKPNRSSPLWSAGQIDFTGTNRNNKVTIIRCYLRFFYLLWVMSMEI